MTRMTIREAALAWGISPQRVLVLCKAGRVKCSRFGKAWVVLQADRPEAKTRGKEDED